MPPLPRGRAAAAALYDVIIMIFIFLATPPDVTRSMFELSIAQRVPDDVEEDDIEDDVICAAIASWFYPVPACLKTDVIDEVTDVKDVIDEGTFLLK